MELYYSKSNDRRPDYSLAQEEQSGHHDDVRTSFLHLILFHTLELRSPAQHCDVEQEISNLQQDHQCCGTLSDHLRLTHSVLAATGYYGAQSSGRRVHSRPEDAEYYGCRVLQKIITTKIITTPT